MSVVEHFSNITSCVVNLLVRRVKGLNINWENRQSVQSEIINRSDVILATLTCGSHIHNVNCVVSACINGTTVETSLIRTHNKATNTILCMEC